MIEAVARAEAAHEVSALHTTPGDAQLRQVGLDDVNSVAARNGGLLDTADLLAGFQFGGERIPLSLLSLK
jgi:hypothetical protein